MNLDTTITIRDGLIAIGVRVRDSCNSTLDSIYTKFVSTKTW